MSRCIRTSVLTKFYFILWGLATHISISGTDAFSLTDSRFIFSPKDQERAWTHLIAIPLEENGDFLRELESVQRAVLEECPVLFHACVTPVMTRLPLLCIDAGNDRHATTKLHEMVYAAVDATKDNGPWMMSFSGLEVDGDGCKVLHTVGRVSSTSTSLQRTLDYLEDAIRSEGWQCSFPEDNAQERPPNDDGNWRPRVPFMRLPDDFESKLNMTKADEYGLGLSPEEGGDGISPIFWYQWWNDEFTPETGTRLRDIAVYARTGAGNAITEAEFYAPRKRVRLPLAVDEEAIELERIERETTEARLNDLLGKEAATQERDISERIRKSTDAYELNKERTQNIGTSSPSVNVKAQMSADELDNDVGIQKIRERLLMINKENSEKKSSINRHLTIPYPSDEHFVGVWKLLSSPVNDENSGTVDDSVTNNSNLVLRVDYGISGGPFLNQADLQKAAGGEWKMFRATWAGPEKEVESEQIRLRMRLLVPPEKKEVLVLEGKVTRLSNARRDIIVGGTDENMDDFHLCCDGEVWVENVEGIGMRNKLGRFSAIKVNLPPINELQYSVKPPQVGGNTY